MGENTLKSVFQNMDRCLSLSKLKRGEGPDISQPFDLQMVLGSLRRTRRRSTGRASIPNIACPSLLTFPSSVRWLAGVEHVLGHMMNTRRSLQKQLVPCHCQAIDPLNLKLTNPFARSWAGVFLPGPVLTEDARV